MLQVLIKEEGGTAKTFSLMASWTTRLSLETLVMTSVPDPALRSKYSMSCLITAFRYRDRIREA